MSDRRTYLYTYTGEIVTVDNPLHVTNADDLTVDAFGNKRVSMSGQRLDVEFLYNKQEEYFDEVTNNGAVTFNSDARDLTLSLSDANDGSYALMRSHPVPYTPGNSQLIELTGVLDLADIGGGTAEVFLRSSVTGSVTEQAITQSNWIDPVSDTNWAKSHIFAMDFQSLKVGRIRYAMNIDGKSVAIGTIENDNIRNTGYWQLASLSAYFRLYNKTVDEVDYTFMELGYGDESNAIGYRYKILANASATMKAICCTVKSEGGLDLQNLQGLPRSIDTDNTPATISTTLIPILSIRPKALYNSLPNLIISFPKSFRCQTDQPIRLVVIHDGTLTDPSWVDVDTDESCMEYDVSATAITNGHVVFSDFITAKANQEATQQGLLGKTVLWHRLGTLTGVFTIAAIRTGNNDATVHVSLQWEEIR